MNERIMLVADYENIRYQCPLRPDKTTYILSADIQADIYIPSRSKSQSGWFSDTTSQANTLIASFLETGALQALVVLSGPNSHNIHIHNRAVTVIDDIQYHVEYQSDNTIQIYTETEEKISFGQHVNNNVVLTHCADSYAFVLVKAQGGWTLHPFQKARDPVYVNGALVTPQQQVSPGDRIHFSGYYLDIEDISLTLYHQNAYELFDLTLYTSPPQADTRYPEFQRPPRKLYPQPTDKISIPNPPSPPAKDRFGLLMSIAPMLTMVLVMALMTLVMGRSPIMLMMSGGMLISTGGIAAYRYFSNKKKKKEEEAERVAFYEDQLNKKRKQIRELIQKQRQALKHTYPTPEECIALAQDFSPRLWERAPDHADFFSIRIGLGNEPLSFSVEYRPQETKDSVKDALTKDAEALAAKFTHNPSLPVSISLKDAYIGIVGSREQTLAHTLAILTELTVLHSYLDMTLIVVYTQESEPALHPFKWMPHTWLGDRQFKGLVSNKTTRDNILTSVHSMLKQRRSEAEKIGGNKLQFPPVVIVVADLDLIYNHVIMEFLSKDNRHLGLFAVFLSESEFSLPESATTLLTFLSPEEATLYQAQAPIPRSYIPDTLTAGQVD